MGPKKFYVPIYPHEGGVLNEPILLTPGITFVEGPTKKPLSKPIVWGDVRSDGKPYHGGSYCPYANVIYYHY